MEFLPGAKCFLPLILIMIDKKHQQSSSHKFTKRSTLKGNGFPSPIYLYYPTFLEKFANQEMLRCISVSFQSHALKKISFPLRHSVILRINVLFSYPMLFMFITKRGIHDESLGKWEFAFFFTKIQTQFTGSSKSLGISELYTL